MRTTQIRFSAPMVRAVLAGTKTQTRRVVKPQPELLYRLTGDNIQVVYNSGELYGFDFPAFKSGIATDPRITELGLHGRLGWQHLLADAIQRLREEGFSGLVSVAGSRNKKGVLECLAVPRKQEGYEISPSLGLHGFSRNAGAENSTDETSGRGAIQQYPNQSGMGKSISKLGGSGGAWSRDEGREASDVEADRQGARALGVGAHNEIVQPAPRIPRSWNVPGCNVRVSQFYEGLNLWVREAWHASRKYDDSPPREIPNTATVEYNADDYRGLNGRFRQSMFMPRWASRISLEIVSVRVERLQDISEADAIAEGIARVADCGNGPIYHPSDSFVGTPTCNPIYAYGQLWEQINGSEGPASWAANPWVWCISFRRID